MSLPVSIRIGLTLTCALGLLLAGLVDAGIRPARGAAPAKPAKKKRRKKPLLLDPSGSTSGLDYFSQGGVVLDGIAYFTADHSCSKYAKGPDYPYVVAFDASTFKKIRTYPFKDTYDSSPMLIQKRDGTWLVVAHEHKLARTVAMDRDTGRVEWVCKDHPGAYFFGYTYYMRGDGSKLILGAFQNGLSAFSCEDGQPVWRVPARSTGGITPCVDQTRGWVFYQSDGQVVKVRATDGKVLKRVAVVRPARCISWNTVLVNDEHGYYVATYWLEFKDGKGKKKLTWNSAIRVYDRDLDLVWERNPVAGGKKSTLTYAHGKLVMGSGNDRARYAGTDWKYIPAFSIKTGEFVWKCDLSDQDYLAVLNVPYYNGHFYAETIGRPGRVYRIHATNGKLEGVIDYKAGIGSCATCIIARGKLLSGDLVRDGIVATVLAENSSADWPGVFGDPQTNTNASADEPRARTVPMREVYVGVRTAKGQGPGR